MSNIEKLAKENGMTVEFVNWFFETKKDGCGNAWFMMMAAMWEGWKGNADMQSLPGIQSAPELNSLQNNAGSVPITLTANELSAILSWMTPPYITSGTHTDEFNELRNKVFYALRDAQNDEPVSNRDEFPLDYLQGHKDGLEWAAQLAEANHPQTGDWLYDEPTELAKAIRKGPDMPAAPQQE